MDEPIDLSNRSNNQQNNVTSSHAEVLTSLSSKKRKRGKEGPNYCLTPRKISAINNAIATSKDRPGEPVFYPYVGTTFNSYEEAKEFYNIYSWEIGFGIRESRSKKNNNDYITRKDIVCSCEGFCSNPRAASARSGCKAKIQLHRTSDHSWIISGVNSEHNHPLSISCGEKKQWGSHGFIDPMTKEFIKRLRRNNVALGHVCSIVGVVSADAEVPIKNMCAKIAQEDIQNDMEKTMNLLQTMKQTDPELDVTFKTDNKGVIEAMIWCTGKNKADYKRFGDVVTFDTKYRTNLYNLPFGIFVGVNNHYQSIIFGGVLLNHERTEDFESTFRNFVEIMGGKQPDTILTDQCQGMAAAIKSTLPGTRHRGCRRHVLRKAKQKIGIPYSKKSGFKKKFNRLITHEVSPSAFERSWSELIAEYKFEANTWLIRAYKMRGMWAKPYFMDVFCAGMTSTQRSKSANHMLKRFIQRSAPMHLFVTKFRDFQFDRNQEEKEKYKTNMQFRRQRSGLAIERHSEAIYTREIHERFCDELYDSGAYTIVDKSSNQCRFTVVHDNEVNKDDASQHTVQLLGSDQIRSSAAVVLLHLDRKQIPVGNIHQKWTRDTAEDSVSKEHIDDDDFNEAVRATDSILAKSKNKDVVHESEGSHNSTQLTSGSQNLEIKCPPRPKRTGRPSNTSLKSWNKYSKLENEVKRTEDEMLRSSMVKEGSDRVGKTRMISDILQVT